MSAQQNRNYLVDPGRPQPEFNLLQRNEKDQIWKSLFLQQIGHGPHPDDHEAVKKRLLKDHRRIVLTVDWVVRKLSAPPSTDLTSDDVHRLFSDTAAGRRFSRPWRLLRWMAERREILLRWAVVGLIAVVAFGRPVSVEAPPAAAPVVVERTKIPSLIYFRMEGPKLLAWDGTGEPSSGNGHWAEVEIRKLK